MFPPGLQLPPQPLPTIVNFTSLNVFRNSIEKIDLSSLLVCNILLV